MRKARVITSWVNTLLLTAALALGILSMSTHLRSLSTSASAPASAVTSVGTTVSGTASAKSPVTFTTNGSHPYRADESFGGRTDG